MSVFNQDAVRQQLEHFVPVAQDVQYLQYQPTDAEVGKFFSTIMEQAPRFNGRSPDTTRQGFYAFDASGRLLGAMNSRRSRRLVRILEEARRQFEINPPTGLTLPATDSPRGPRPPEGTEVARVFTRISPKPTENEDPRSRERRRRRDNNGIGRDYLWMSKDEVTALRKGQLSEAWLGRILRFHLLDNVRGEPDPWSADNVELAQFESPNVDRSEEQTVVSFTGQFRMRANATERLPERGYEGTLEGQITFGPKGALTDLKILATGEAWGRSRYTPGSPDGRFPLKIAFVNATQPRHREVPPGMYFFGAHRYWNPNVKLPTPSRP